MSCCRVCSKEGNGGVIYLCVWNPPVTECDPYFWLSIPLMAYLLTQEAFHTVKGYVNSHIWSCIPRVQYSRNFQRTLMVKLSATQVGCCVRSMVKSNTPGYGLIFDSLWCDDSCSESAMQRERELITDDDNHDRNFKKKSWGAKEL